MRDTVYVLVFEGFADWQVALALAEIRRPGDWDVRSVGFTREPVTSMSGLQVLPDIDTDELDLSAVALLILPGGHLWLSKQIEQAAALAHRVHDGVRRWLPSIKVYCMSRVPACLMTPATPATGRARSAGK